MISTLIYIMLSISWLLSDSKFKMGIKLVGLEWFSWEKAHWKLAWIPAKSLGTTVDLTRKTNILLEVKLHHCKKKQFEWLNTMFTFKKMHYVISPVSGVCIMFNLLFAVKPVRPHW